MKISEEIRARMQMLVERGVAVSAIAHAAGISQPSLHYFMHGKATLNLNTVDKLAEHLGIEIEHMDGFDPYQYPLDSRRVRHAPRRGKPRGVA